MSGVYDNFFVFFCHPKDHFHGKHKLKKELMSQVEGLLYHSASGKYTFMRF